MDGPLSFLVDRLLSFSLNVVLSYGPAMFSKIMLGSVNNLQNPSENENSF
jgi:hypothetical protein